MLCPACSLTVPDAGDADHRVTEIRKGEFSLQTCLRSQRVREAGPSNEKDIATLKERLDRAGIPPVPTVKPNPQQQQ